MAFPLGLSSSSCGHVQRSLAPLRLLPLHTLIHGAVPFLTTSQTCRAAQKATMVSTKREMKPDIIPGLSLVNGDRFHELPLAWETLQGFPKTELSGKVVLVRLDLSVYFKADVIDIELPPDAVYTIVHLIICGARIVIASHWSPFQYSNGVMDSQMIADCLSQQLDKKISVVNSVVGPATKKAINDLSNGDILLLGNLKLYKEEVANDKDFARELAENVDILVNDAFSISHRVLASTVGVACFTSARLAGFQLQRELLFLNNAMSPSELPIVAVIGGSKLSLLIGVLSKLVDKCDSVIVTGSMVHTFFNSLGYYCPSSFVERNLVSDALKFLSTAAEKGVDVILPLDFVCANKDHARQIFSADNIVEGWWPVGLGPSTLEKIQKTLFPSKVAIWIGAVSINNQTEDLQASNLLARTFADITQDGCLTIAGGIEPMSALKREGLSSSVSHICRGGAAFIEFLKGANLPGVSALDFACPKIPDWKRIYDKPEQPLFVDIGCGNGLFILKMARFSGLSVNFLGLEIRKKLVDRCSRHVSDQNLTNVHFMQADAATTFKRILSTYPAEVGFVSIQCPVPNFSNTDCRRRMVQKQLVEQIIGILAKDGKIFLQSDVKSVALQLREDFMEYGKGCIGLSIEHEYPSKCDDEGWLVKNPYGISSDWEDHVLACGKRMYRVLLARI